MLSSRYAFVDVEVGIKDRKIHDIGAIRWDGAFFHSANKRELMDFLQEVEYVCGHNIIHHDAHYLFDKETSSHYSLVDTLYMSPLLFPERLYHRLLKNDKLLSEQVNNPVNDCEKARDLLMDEVAQWHRLSSEKKTILATLLHNQEEFQGFLSFVGALAGNKEMLVEQIGSAYNGQICSNANLENIIQEQPCELAYALALIDTTDHRSITPAWVLHHYPNVEYVVQQLRHTSCNDGEFDDVYMLISEPPHITDEVLRRYYVGMTRAKTRLFIHTDGSLFDHLPADRHCLCQQMYDMPQEIVLQLSHRDVNLGFFKTRKNEILALRAGEPLHFNNNYLYTYH